jgi:RNA polymerase sigma-70 factor (ECF subfamily)
MGYTKCNVMAKKPLATKDMLESEIDFENVYREHARSIYRFLYWRTGDATLSDDLTSNVFEKAWRSRSNFHGGSVQAWLYRIARNLLIDTWRAKKDIPTEDMDSFSETSDDLGATFDKQLRIERLEQALEKLPVAMRSVVSLRFISGLSARQVASKLGMSEGNVRIVQYRALKKMKDYLDEQA